MMITTWLMACISHWTIASTGFYIVSVILTQLLGMIWYSELLWGRRWIRDQLPKERLQTDDDWQIFWQHPSNNLFLNHNNCATTRMRHDSIKYQVALLGTIISFYIFRGLLFIILSSNDNNTSRMINGMWIGCTLLTIKSIFGMMHPLFEERTLTSYAIHCGYDIVSFMLAGLLLPIKI
jgi:Protein of unknown function (DUF1761)